MNKINNKKQTHRYREQTDNRHSEGGWGLGEKDEGIAQRKGKKVSWAQTAA